MIRRTTSGMTRLAAAGYSFVLSTFLASTLILMLPSLAGACSVCTAGRDEENQLAYILMTVFMSLLPLLAVGTLGFILWRRVKKLEAEVAAKQ